MGLQWRERGDRVMGAERRGVSVFVVVEIACASTDTRKSPFLLYISFSVFFLFILASFFLPVSTAIIISGHLEVFCAKTGAP